MTNSIKILHGDCRELLRGLVDHSVDSIVTDPPYELGFMGKKWDNSGVAYDINVWRECLRVLKPGGHLLSFGGTRTYHRMTCAIEDAGFEIRDCIMWVHGSGFPKSHNVSKAIDKAVCDAEAAKQWQGWGSALKPAVEPIVVARKPLDGTIADNVLRHGTGGINVDDCRVGTEEVRINTFDDGAKPFGGGAGHPYTGRTVIGRWPANIIHDGSDEVVGLFQKDNARFFYCAKASPSEKNANSHPTVKPIALIRYLVRLVTPTKGTVLDPFAGSGTTLVAARNEGFSAIGCEIAAEYCAIIRNRLDIKEETETEAREKETSQCEAPKRQKQQISLF